ncbi:putative RlpA-like domain superfamily, kiwellin [Helianthus annuus]|uniref:Putative ripening-related protein 6 n=2 Tax=Helianthus annuus TaxID=4232 RepID=A0A251VB43_HELAN|nr:putative RlpA-like domain superfamily, kiwellin [Helianthus annuus]KAJ0594338.1 putative RlpA-like domain superfamily, kiwellin [Helianthus annuus]KAJ0602491.1 putative RlpA-like domain superfamily, kiwellin [Helianthus annuus]KAJ0609363.1 putative RlpA-like domain superfamily, kiwellin [Helianthus annuus]KAJ0769424.1 putative RlpA-like domain superfamily, kiwellin [Helianthus annuus]
MKTSRVVFLLLITLLISCIEARYKLSEGKNTSMSQHYKRPLFASTNTNAVMTLNNFEKGGDGGGPSECDGEYHSNNLLIVALSSRWYNHGQRCLNYINIYYKEASTQAMVVDECSGCGDDIVDASSAVWVALGVSQSDWGETGITWSDA